MKESIKQFFFYLIIKYRINDLALDKIDYINVFGPDTAKLIKEILENNSKIYSPVEGKTSLIKEWNILNRHIEIYNNLFPDFPIESPIPIPNLRMISAREINNLVTSTNMISSVVGFFKPSLYQTTREKSINELRIKIGALNSHRKKTLGVIDPGYYFLNEKLEDKLRKEFFDKLFFCGRVFRRDSNLHRVSWVQKLFMTLINAYQKNNINYSYFLHMTPFLWACTLGNKYYINQMIKEGADISLVCNCCLPGKCFDWSIATPLYLASWYGNWEMVEVLLKAKADPNVKCCQGQIALHKAAEYSTPETIELLLKAGSDPNLKAQAYGIDYLTPFDCALLANNTDVAAYFLKNGLVKFLSATNPLREDMPNIPGDLKNRYVTNLAKAISLLEPEFLLFREDAFVYKFILRLLKESNLELDCRETLKKLIEIAHKDAFLTVANEIVFENNESQSEVPDCYSFKLSL